MTKELATRMGSSNINFESYDVSVEDWSSYVERLESYFVVNGIEDKMKVPAILSLMGATTYKLLKNLATPNIPSELTYQDIVKLLSEHLNPKPLEMTERFRFYKRKQFEGDVKSMIALAPAIKLNGGGHINHSIFWHNLSPSGGVPQGDLLSAIKSDFGSLENLQNLLSTAAVGVQGSGWAWLGFNPQAKKLQITTCANQDPLQATTGLVPLFGIDVWEHAYYLQYENVRPDYVKAIWKVANWKDISDRYSKAKSS